MAPASRALKSPQDAAMMRTVAEIVLLLLVGWVAGAETGSWCCVQPVVARLPYEHFVTAEQDMLRTFGRIMPVLMPLTVILAAVFAAMSRHAAPPIKWLRIAAALCIAVTVASSLIVNIPINNRTVEWQITSSEADWRAMRARWHGFQGLRGALFMSSFVLLVLATTIDRRSMSLDRG
jgi:Domain of unknown function (DUF1772)